jgi:hypothetical protein
MTRFSQEDFHKFMQTERRTEIDGPKETAMRTYLRQAHQACWDGSRFLYGEEARTFREARDAKRQSEGQQANDVLDT